MWLILLSIVVVLLYWLSTRSLDYWESKGVPYEKPIPFFGNFKNIILGKESIAALFDRLYNEFSDAPYFGFYILQTPYLSIREPDIIKQVLIKDFNSFMNRRVFTDEKIEPLGYHVLVAAKGQTWKSLRAKLSPVFTSGKLKLMLPLMQDVSRNLKNYFENKSGSVINAYDVMKNYSVDVISSCAFGIESNSIKNENSEFKEMSTKMFDFTKFNRAFAIMCYFFMPIFVKIFRFRFIESTSADFFINVFKKTYYQRKSLGIQRNDLIDLLHHLKEQEKEDDDYKFDDLKLSAQAILFFNAGNDTTTSMLGFALYELALNTDIQEKLRKELHENVDENNQFSYESLLDMPYLDMVVQETLRKYPLTSLLNREATEDYTFEKTGMKIPKNTPIIIPVSSLHYDPKYFPNPKKFDPERFSTGEKRKAVQYVFLPFGDGPRKCIGERFALVSIKTALSTIIKDFRISLTENTDVPLKTIVRAPFLQPLNRNIPLRIEKL